MATPSINDCGAFTFAGSREKFTLADFWGWYGTHLMSNIIRGHLAEFIVANALGISECDRQDEWESFDLLLNGNKRIEIKASAYIQDWKQAANTNPRFSIRPSRRLEDGVRYGDKAWRNSDMYIFCVFAETDRSSADPLVLDKWEFYPVLTSMINNMLGQQKSIGMGTICRMCPEPFNYASLRDAVNRLFEKESEIAKL